MKQAVLVFAFLLAATLSFSQQHDTVYVYRDTLNKGQANGEKSVKHDTRPFKEKIAFGFGSSFWITSHETYLEIAPVIAYRFPKALITGLGYRYIYRNEHTGPNLNAWGPDVFARLKLLKRVYLWTEYELLHNQYTAADESRQLTTANSWFAGLGYIRSIGKKGRGGISAQLLYNILYNKDVYNPYYSPVTYRVGYYF